MTSNQDPEDHNTRICVLIANLVGAAAQLVTQLIAMQPDMQLVGEVQDQVELLFAVSAGVDVLVLGAPRVHPPPGICSHLLSEFPHLRIVVLSTTGDRAALYWLGLQQQTLPVVSATTLVDSIRQLYTLNPTV